jgi:hypothetical protein
MVFHLRPARGSRRAPLNSSEAAAAAAKFRRRLPLEVGTQKRKPAFPGQSPTTPQVSSKAPVHDNRTALLYIMRYSGRVIPSKMYCRARRYE